MLLYRSAVMLLFQSTLPREERLCQRIINMVLGYFNPRSHERSDKPFIYKALRTIISIHAPTRGATQLSPHPKTLSHFNPRSHERSDAPKWDIDFTIPDFNPRSHERSDLFCFMRFAISSGISIHAPTRGATVRHDFIQDQQNISIHAPTRGATKHMNILDYLTEQFQSTLPREERHQAGLSLCLRSVFQSTLPREERQG